LVPPKRQRLWTKLSHMVQLYLETEGYPRQFQKVQNTNYGKNLNQEFKPNKLIVEKCLFIRKVDRDDIERSFLRSSKHQLQHQLFGRLYMIQRARVW